MPEVDIGIGKSGRQAFSLDEIAIVPSRRTRDPEDVDVSWQLDAFRFEIPVMAAPMDAVVSPTTAIAFGELGGLAVLNLEGLWCRYDDPKPLLFEIAALAPDKATARLQELYAAPVRAELVKERIRAVGATGGVTCGALTPQRVPELAAVILEAELDVLVIQGTVVSAEHVTKGDDPLNLKRFIRELDIPVVVGGCSSYQAALHLMRTGAVGVLVGVGSGSASTVQSVLGIGAPLATAIADAAGARSQHLEETGVYVQVIADGGLRRGGDVAKAVACGADAVMIGSLFAGADEAPGGGALWGAGASHPNLPRGAFRRVATRAPLAEILAGPAHDDSGTTNIVGALRSAMAMCGYASIREFHKADVVVAASATRSSSNGALS